MEKRNKIERIKAQQSASAFWAQIETFDWHHPDEADRFYLKSFGIYNIKIRPDAWMIRLRIDGGELPVGHVRALAELTGHYDLSLLVTARSQIELHGLSAETVYPVYRALQTEGIDTRQTLTDNFRAITTDPLDGFTRDSAITCRPIIETIRRHILGRPEWMGTLPRKFNTALVGRETPSFNPWGNDLLFALAEQEGRRGFNLYLGGKNSETAHDADLFCLPEQVPGCFMAVARLYRQHGLRSSRAKTRLYHLIETVGMAQIRRWLENTLSHPLRPAGTLQMRSSTENTDHLLPVERYGTYGEITPETLHRIARKAEKNNTILRLTPHQELWLFSPDAITSHTLYPADRQPPSTTRKATEVASPISNLQSLISLPAHKTTTCAGSRYCGLSLWNIKHDVQTLPVRRLVERGISIGFSGCLKGCGRHYHSDIGLIGLRTNLYGETERAVRLFLGAVQTPDPAPARMIYYSVPERSLDRLFQTILDDVAHSGHETFEAFSRYVLNRYSVELIQAWYLVRQLFEIGEALYRLFVSGKDETTLWSALEALPDYPSCEARYEAIREMSHRLWDRNATDQTITPPTNGLNF